MKWLRSLAVPVVALVLAWAPAAAQRISAFPNAATLTGAEKIPASQGTNCTNVGVQSCTTVSLTPAQIAAYLTPTFQPRDSDLDAIAALNTAVDQCIYWTGSHTAALYGCAGYGRSLLGSADAPTARTTLGVTATGADTTYLFRANNLSGLTDVVAARTNLGLGTMATQSAPSYAALSGAAFSGSVSAPKLLTAATAAGLSAGNVIAFDPETFTPTGASLPVSYYGLTYGAWGASDYGVGLSAYGPLRFFSGGGVRLTIAPGGATFTGSVSATTGTFSGNITFGTASTPASASAACIIGQQAWDASYYYVCVATNSWKRAALAAW